MRFMTFAVILLLAGCAAAPNGPEAPLSPRLSQAPSASVRSGDVEAGNYELDPRHASVIWRIRHQGLSWYTGRFNTLSARLTLDSADPSRSVLEAHIDARSVDSGLP